MMNAILEFVTLNLLKDFLHDPWLALPVMLCPSGRELISDGIILAGLQSIPTVATKPLAIDGSNHGINSLRHLAPQLRNP